MISLKHSRVSEWLKELKRKKKCVTGFVLCDLCMGVCVFTFDYSHMHTHTHTHTHHTHTHTHTHTHVGFYGLRGLSIGIMVFILYKLYVLLPYTYPTPKLSPHRRRCISTFPPKNAHCMIYKRFKLWGHWKCPHKPHTHTHTHTHMGLLWTLEV